MQWALPTFHALILIVLDHNLFRPDLIRGSLGVGWGRLHNARIPWTIRYDEVLTVFEGELRLHTGGEMHVLQPRDCIWLPAGTELVYEADAALVHFAIHPSNWHEIS